MSFENENLIDIQLNYKPLSYNSEKFRIFGKNFVNHNKDKCKIIYKNKEYELTEYFEEINNKYNHKDIIILILRIVNPLNDLSYMFCGCETLLEFLELDEANITDISQSDTVSSLKSEKNKSIINISVDKNDFFVGTNDELSLKLSSIQTNSISSLTNDYDILFKNNSLSSLQTSNVTDMSHMFEGCNSLKKLPDISKWDTSKVIDMAYMFDGCSSLMSIPDLSKWNISNVTD